MRGSACPACPAWRLLAAATLKFRARPAIIPKLVAAMGQHAELARQSTRAEDLSGPIADSARQLAMLDDYRTRLGALRSRAGCRPAAAGRS